MSQLSEHEMSTIWPGGRKNKITLIVHVKDRSKQIERLLLSVQGLVDRSIVLIDNRTTEPVESVANSLGAEIGYFKWRDDFSYPKNILTKMIPEGEWILCMGSDFEMPFETIESIKHFISDSCNVAARFRVDEFALNQADARSRNRTLLWRSHHAIYWEGYVHEDIVGTLFSQTYLGIPYKKEWNLPIIGSLLHYGDHENTKDELFSKRLYYKVLWDKWLITKRLKMDGTILGLLYASLPLLKSMDDVKQFIDKAKQDELLWSSYGKIHSDEELDCVDRISREPQELLLKAASWEASEEASER